MATVGVKGLSVEVERWSARCTWR